MAAYAAVRIPSAGITGLPNSIRVPATPDNWSYLRLLRNAEDSQWKATGAQLKEGAPGSLVPSVNDFRAEAWLMRILGAISMAAVGYAAVESTRLAESWIGFVAWVRLAVGG